MLQIIFFISRLTDPKSQSQRVIGIIAFKMTETD